MHSISDFASYCLRHALRRITVGQGGAQVYELDGGRIAKHVRRDQVPEESWLSYRRESRFYARGIKADFLPEVLFHECREDELLLILRQYQPVPKDMILDRTFLSRVMETLSRIHALPPMEDAQTPPAFHLSAEDAQRCRLSWLEVIAPHREAFCAGVVEDIARQINAVNAQLHQPVPCLCHGDFHIENLLLDENGGIRVCDWQACRTGDATEDISFLLSRLAADGYPLELSTALELYCAHAGRTDQARMENQMRLANLNTSFLHWHYFLRGAQEGRIRSVFEPMAQDAAMLAAQLQKK